MSFGIARGEKDGVGSEALGADEFDELGGFLFVLAHVSHLVLGDAGIFLDFAFAFEDVGVEIVLKFGGELGGV